MRRALVVGWASVPDGEATAGDVLSMDAVARALRGAGVAVDVAFSPVMTPPGGLELSAADPARYSHLVWVCGPLHGPAVGRTAARFAGCERLAAGVSVVDPDDPVLAEFSAVLARDAPGAAAVRDLSAGPAAALAAAMAPPAARGQAGGPLSVTRGAVDGGEVDGGAAVVGVVLAPGQAEYGPWRRHGEVTAVLADVLADLRVDVRVDPRVDVGVDGVGRGVPVACVEIDTRLDPRSWRNPTSPAALLALLRRCDVVVTQRLHGLVLALACGVPALALDPVAGPEPDRSAGLSAGFRADLPDRPGADPSAGALGGPGGVSGGKVTAQARAWGWPAVLGARELLGGVGAARAAIGEQLAWCLSPAGVAAAARAADQAPAAGAADLARLVDLVCA